MMRFELMTSSLPRKRSTPELHRRKVFIYPYLIIFKEEMPAFAGFFLSGRPGSNRRHSAWKADALPTELLPLIILLSIFKELNYQNNKVTLYHPDNYRESYSRFFYFNKCFFNFFLAFKNTLYV